MPDLFTAPTVELSKAGGLADLEGPWPGSGGVGPLHVPLLRPVRRCDQGTFRRAVPFRIRLRRHRRPPPQPAPAAAECTRPVDAAAAPQRSAPRPRPNPPAKSPPVVQPSSTSREQARVLKRGLLAVLPCCSLWRAAVVRCSGWACSMEMGGAGGASGGAKAPERAVAGRDSGRVEWSTTPGNGTVVLRVRPPNKSEVRITAVSGFQRNLEQLGVLELVGLPLASTRPRSHQGWQVVLFDVRSQGQPGLQSSHSISNPARTGMRASVVSSGRTRHASGR